MPVRRLIFVAIGIYVCAFANTALYFMSLSTNPLHEWKDVIARSDFASQENEGAKFVVAETVGFFEVCGEFLQNFT
jgi:hypothetical protein